VIRTRDIIFNKNKFYNSDKPDLAQLNNKPIVIVLFLPPVLTSSSIREDKDIYNYENLTGSLFDFIKDLIKDLTGSFELTINAPLTSAATMVALELYTDKSKTQLPILFLTERAASSPTDEEREGGHTGKQRTGNNRAIKHNKISVVFDNYNILPEGSKRTRKPRKEVYSTVLQRAGKDELYRFYTVFSRGYTTPEPK
jgi:hypothetical protein